MPLDVLAAWQLHMSPLNYMQFVQPPICLAAYVSKLQMCPRQVLNGESCRSNCFVTRTCQLDFMGESPQVTSFRQVSITNPAKTRQIRGKNCHKIDWSTIVYYVLGKDFRLDFYSKALNVIMLSVAEYECCWCIMVSHAKKPFLHGRNFRLVHALRIHLKQASHWCSRFLRCEKFVRVQKESKLGYVKMQLDVGNEPTLSLQCLTKVVNIYESVLLISP